MKTENEGFIVLHRKFLHWEWYQKADMVTLFITLLLLANHEAGKWQGHPVERGQLITGLHSLSKATGLSVQSIRTCLERLKSTGEITYTSTNKFRLITIINYSRYQDKPKKSTSNLTGEVTINQQATNNQSTTNNNVNNNNNLTNNIYSLEKLIEPVIGQYSPALIEAFLNHWTQKNPGGTKELWQMHKVFDPAKRLATWKRNDEKWAYQQSQKRQLSQVNEMPRRQTEDTRVDTGLTRLTF